ncbi:MAG TPA: hypothetical protein VEV43_06460 [Actinomycetota bacterium]|nr:hypothetical protein [Actinomycetota bacterium]
MRAEGVLQAFPRARAALPKGRALPARLWATRHRAVLGLLWLHVPALAELAAVRGYSPLHSLLEISIVAAAALLATWHGLDRPARAAVATFGLFTCSALLVHFSGGLTEMHFHFFVMVVVVALYQDWFPFLVGIAFVLLHHGVIGTLAPQDVYSSATAVENPWGWAAVHAGFILAESVACLAAWKKSEQYAAQIAEQAVRRREALELNDQVVQGLVVAKASFELGDVEGGRKALDATLGRAKDFVSDLLGQDHTTGTAQPGSLVREKPATVRPK